MKATKLMLRLAGATALLALAAPALPCDGMKGGTAFDAAPPPAQEKATKEKDPLAVKTATQKPGEKPSAKSAEKPVKN